MPLIVPGSNKSSGLELFARIITSRALLVISYPDEELAMWYQRNAKQPSIMLKNIENIMKSIQLCYQYKRTEENLQIIAPMLSAYGNDLLRYLKSDDGIASMSNIRDIFQQQKWWEDYMSILSEWAQEKNEFKNILKVYKNIMNEINNC